MSKDIHESSNAYTILDGERIELFLNWDQKEVCHLVERQILNYKDAKLETTKQLFNSNRSLENEIQPIINQGIFNLKVLKSLREKGICDCIIMKTMKFGLISLSPQEIKYFEDFPIFSDISKIEDVLMKDYRNELISNLKPIGLSCSECWHIIIYGILNQSGSVLLKLLISGIDIPGILNWHSSCKIPNENVTKVLRTIGINENILQFALKYGIDIETEEVLKYLGYNIYEELINLNVKEETSRNCLIEMQNENSEKYLSYNLASSSDINQDRTLLKANELARSDYNFLKKNLTEPLVWGINRVLNYNPSDPIHYLAHQLLYWKYNK